MLCSLSYVLHCFSLLLCWCVTPWIAPASGKSNLSNIEFQKKNGLPATFNRCLSMGLSLQRKASPRLLFVIISVFDFTEDACDSFSIDKCLQTKTTTTEQQRETTTTNCDSSSKLCKQETFDNFSNYSLTKLMQKSNVQRVWALTVLKSFAVLHTCIVWKVKSSVKTFISL